MSLGSCDITFGRNSTKASLPPDKPSARVTEKSHPQAPEQTGTKAFTQVLEKQRVTWKVLHETTITTRGETEHETQDSSHEKEEK